jgi:hypothetical protein
MAPLDDREMSDYGLFIGLSSAQLINREAGKKPRLVDRFARLTSNRHRTPEQPKFEGIFEGIVSNIANFG